VNHPVPLALGRHSLTPPLAPLTVATSSPSAIQDDDPEAVRPRLPTDDAPSSLQGPRRNIAIAAVLAAMVLAVLDAAIVNVALPTMAQSLQVRPGMAVWIITAYQTALVMGQIGRAHV
jgi:hypothetical protein